MAISLYDTSVANYLQVLDSTSAVLAKGAAHAAENGIDLADIVAMQLGFPEIFGPSFSGQFWEESINNTGDFTNWGIFADVDYKINDKWNVMTLNDLPNVSCLQRKHN